MSNRLLFTTGSLLAIAICMAIGEERDKSQPRDADSKNASRDSANKIERELGQPFSADFVDIPLKEVLEKIAEDYQISIWPDTKSLSEEGISLDSTITLKVKDVTLRSGLRLVLESLLLTSVIDSGVLRITTQTVADEMMFTRVYPVRDLISADDQDEFKTLIKMIQRSTRGRWQEFEGQPQEEPGDGGSISPMPIAAALVIRQSQSVQREIDGLLTAIRRARQLQRIPSIAADPDDIEDLATDKAERK